MTWQPTGRAVDPSFFEPFEPSEVLYDFDGPRIFTVRSSDGDMLVAYQCGEHDETQRFVVAAVKPSEIEALRVGGRTMREILDQPFVWIVDRGFAGGVSQATKTHLVDVPSDVLPKDGVYLSPEHAPWLDVTMVGADLRGEVVPASVVRRLTDGVMGALKNLVEYVSSAIPVDRRRVYYDLPVTRLAFGSLRVTFEPPAPGQALSGEEARHLAEVERLLKRGVELAASGRDIPEPADAEARAVLGAVARLVPPLKGAVDEVRLGGRLLGWPAQSVALDRKSAQRVREALKLPDPDLVPVKLEGRPREFDKTLASFTLRDAAENDIAVCFLSDDVYDDAYSAFLADQWITVLGHASRKRKAVEVVAIDVGKSEDPSRAS